MKEEERIKQMNEVISDFFENKTKENTVAVKELMSDFIKAGIFVKDQKKGLPIRKILRALDEQNALEKIPTVHPERKEQHTYWYFQRAGTSYVSDTPNDTGFTKKQKAKAIRAGSDEHYVLDLCDEVLASKASRQHKFGFLLGDYHKDGKSRTVLPVDAYYEEKNLVIEYTESQHDEADGTSDKPEKITVSGVSRSEQRKIYVERRKNGLKSNDIHLVEIDYSSFACDSTKKLIRDREKDFAVVKMLLKEYK